MGAGQPPPCPHPIVTISGALSLTSAPGTTLPPPLVGILPLNSIYSRPLEGPHQITVWSHTRVHSEVGQGVPAQITQRMLFFFKTEKPNHFIFQHTVPSNSPSLILPVGCTLPSLSHAFLPEVPPLPSHSWSGPSLAPSPHLHTHVLAPIH